jgi:hypothetical protein
MPAIPNDNAPLINIPTRQPNRVRAGQAISAANTNATIDVARALSGAAGPPRQRKPSASRAPTGIEASTRVFFCS